VHSFAVLAMILPVRVLGCAEMCNVSDPRAFIAQVEEEPVGAGIDPLIINLTVAWSAAISGRGLENCRCTVPWFV
jgi:hypothetical protein